MSIHRQFKSLTHKLLNFASLILTSVSSAKKRAHTPENVPNEKFFNSRELGPPTLSI
jgi:hypothetical protein